MRAGASEPSGGRDADADADSARRRQVTRRWRAWRSAGTFVGLERASSRRLGVVLALVLAATTGLGATGEQATRNVNSAGAPAISGQPEEEPRPQLHRPGSELWRPARRPARVDASELEANEREHEAEHEARGAPANEEGRPAAVSFDELAPSNQLGGPSSKLHIVHLLAPEATQNGTQNITLDCMFKFDKKLDQRLTVKWFFEDELEPIYQWLPELNKRVYSDKYERFLDKDYQVSEDVEFMLAAYRRLAAGDSQAPLSASGEPAARPASLAGRLERLARLGGRASQQLLDGLRQALDMEPLEWARFRALRLVRPTSQLSGRFTCSVSSLDADDLRSTRLVVYEPAASLSFNVSRVTGPSPSLSPQYNLSCAAEGVFPRPTLSLLRLRAGPLEPAQGRAGARARLAAPATLLRQEPLAKQHVRVEAPAWRPGQAREPAGYSAASWALVDEDSLASGAPSHFECLLSLEGSDFEQRQALALQRGWHVNAAALVSRSTLVGLLSALASLLCLLLALASSVLILRLLKRHARNRVHKEPGDAEQSPAALAGEARKSAPLATLTDMLAAPADSGASGEPERVPATALAPASANLYSAAAASAHDNGLYRVPSGAGTRFVIGPPSAVRHMYATPAAIAARRQQASGARPQPGRPADEPAAANQAAQSARHTRPALYC